MQPEIVNQRVLPFILRLQRKFDYFTHLCFTLQVKSFNTTPALSVKVEISASNICAAGLNGEG